MALGTRHDFLALALAGLFVEDLVFWAFARLRANARTRIGVPQLRGHAELDVDAVAAALPRVPLLALGAR